MGVPAARLKLATKFFPAARLGGGTACSPVIICPFFSLARAHTTTDECAFFVGLQQSEE